MPKSLNKVCLIGHVGKDPETRFTQAGKAVANFSLATTESWKDSNGTKQERTEWHRIVIWGLLAEKVIDPYVKKGDPIYLEGKIQSRKWQDDSGAERTSYEIVCDNVILLGNKGGNGGGGSEPRQTYQQRAEVGDPGF